MTAVDPNAQNMPQPVSGVPQTINGSTTSLLLLPENSLRKGATFANPATSNGTWYLQLGTGLSASLTTYSVHIPPDWYYEVPFGFCGDITGISNVQGPNTHLTFTEIS